MANPLASTPNELLSVMISSRHAVLLTDTREDHAERRLLSVMHFQAW